MRSTSLSSQKSNRPTSRVKSSEPLLLAQGKELSAPNMAITNRYQFPIPATELWGNSDRTVLGKMSQIVESQAPATGLRKPKSPKVLGRVLGRVPGKRGLLGGLLRAVPFLFFSKETGLPALLPAVPSAVLFFPALYPALLGIWAFSVL